LKNNQAVGVKPLQRKQKKTKKRKKQETECKNNSTNMNSCSLHPNSPGIELT